MIPRGRFALVAVCALMFATIGVGGVMAAPVPAVKPAGSAIQLAATQQTANTTLAPSASRTSCLKRGETVTTNASGVSSMNSPASQPGLAPILPQVCPDTAPKKTTAELIAAATHQRVAAGIEKANPHSTPASKPARYTQPATARKPHGTASTASGPLTPGSTAAPNSSSLQIYGTVTNASATPLSDVEVDAYDSDGNFYDEYVTGADGAYTIDVVPGDYTLFLGDLTNTYASGYYNATSGSGFTYDEDSASVVIVTSVDVTADVTMPLIVHITGTVTDSSATPLESIDVEVLDLNGSSIAGTGTASDGTYSIEVEPGSYKLWFGDDSGDNASGYYSTSGFTYSDSAASKIKVSASGDTTIDITLPPAVHITGTVSKSGGAALAGITVYADSTSARYEADTDSSGNYSVVVAPGSYTLFFQDGDTYGSGYYSTAGFTYNSAAATTIVVASVDVTGKNITLPSAVHIKGTVTDSGGTPLEGIEVDVYGSNVNFENWVDTDADGTYTITAAPGSYLVSFYDDNETYGSGYYSTAGFTYDQGFASLVTVSTADVTGKNVKLPLAVHVMGTLTLSHGDTPEGIEIDVHGSGPNGNYSTVDDGDGNYSLAVSPGSYTVYFNDYTGTYGSGYYIQGTATDFTYDSGAASTVTVSTADVGGINATLPDALHITGTVTDPSADPISGIEVDLGSPGSNTTGYSVNTDDDGDYSLAVPPGDYTLSFYDDSGTYGSGYYIQGIATDFTYDSGSESTVTVTTADVNDIDVTLPLAVHITGTVTKTGGGAVSGIEVSTDTASSNAIGATRPAATTGDGSVTDADGHYSIAVSPGDYTVYFFDPSDTYGSGYYVASTPTDFTYDSNSASSVSVTSSDVTANVVLPLAIHINGKVTKSGGTGLPNIGVEAYDKTIGYENEVSTDANGNYSVAVAPGSYTLYFWDDTDKYGDGYYSTAGFTYLVTSATAVTVTSADVTGKNVTLPLALHIKGKVTKSGGAALSDIEVFAYNADDSYENWTWTAADGTYSLVVAPGTYTLEFSDRNGTYGSGYYSSAGFTYFATSATKVTVSSADVTGKNVVLPLAIHISGKVTNSGGAGIGDVAVEAVSTGYSNVNWTFSDGTYSVPVAPGSYRLYFQDNSGTYAFGYYSTGGFVYNLSQASTVVVSSTNVTGKNVVLPLAVYIQGTVTNSGHSALGGVEVVTSSADRTYANGVSTLNNGTYSMQVNPGSYKVWFLDRSGVNGSGYYSTGGFVYSESAASAVVVSTSTVTGIDVEMAAGPTQVFPASSYYPITPARILDTRPTGSGHTNMGLTGKFTAGAERTFGVAEAPYVGGKYYAVPYWATAVTGNLTLVGETAAGVITLGPATTSGGATTTINFGIGDTRANNVTVGLSPDGSLSAVYRSSTVGATTDVIFDVTGYFMPDSVYGASYHAVAPGRVLDTRKTGSGHTNIGLAGKFVTKTVRTFSVAGVKGLGWSSALVPSNAAAVTGNLTITNATSVGYVSVGPTVAAVPSTSTLNVAKGANVANGVTVALKAGKLQAVWDGTAGSSADVIFDITGYFTPDTTGLAFHPIVPDRLLDTTTGKGLVGVFTSLTSRPLAIGGVDAIPADAAGISGNLTVVNPSSNGFAFISPAVVTSPTSSTLNAVATKSIANGFDVALQGGGLYLIWCGTAGSTADLQLDVTGYWK